MVAERTIGIETSMSTVRAFQIVTCVTTESAIRIIACKGYQSKFTTVESRFNDLRFNDIPGITINIRSPAKVIVKCMGQNPGLTIFGLTIFPV